MLGTLVVANAALVLALIAFMSPSWSSGPGTASPSAAHADLAEALSPEECQQRAVQMLWRAGLGGTASFALGETLQLDLVYPVAQGESVQLAAQQVWTAFDIALALSEGGCDIFSRIAVVVQPQRDETPTQFRAWVDKADLQALDSAEISEDEFIDRVQYVVEPSGGG
jgi:hypothetical protein